MVKIQPLLVKIDSIADYVPGLQTLSNIVVLIAKAILHLFGEQIKLNQNPYLAYIRGKTVKECLLLAFLPYFGIIIRKCLGLEKARIRNYDAAFWNTEEIFDLNSPCRKLFNSAANLEQTYIYQNLFEEDFIKESVRNNPERIQFFFDLDRSCKHITLDLWPGQTLDHLPELEHFFWNQSQAHKKLAERLFTPTFIINSIKKHPNHCEFFFRNCQLMTNELLMRVIKEAPETVLHVYELCSSKIFLKLCLTTNIATADYVSHQLETSDLIECFENNERTYSFCIGTKNINITHKPEVNPCELYFQTCLKDNKDLEQKICKTEHNLVENLLLFEKDNKEFFKRIVKINVFHFKKLFSHLTFNSNEERLEFKSELFDYCLSKNDLMQPSPFAQKILFGLLKFNFKHAKKFIELNNELFFEWSEFDLNDQECREYIQKFFNLELIKNYRSQIVYYLKNNYEIISVLSNDYISNLVYIENASKELIFDPEFLNDNKKYHELVKQLLQKSTYPHQLFKDMVLQNPDIFDCLELLSFENEEHENDYKIDLIFSHSDVHNYKLTLFKKIKFDYDLFNRIIEKSPQALLQTRLNLKNVKEYQFAKDVFAKYKKILIQDDEFHDWLYVHPEASLFLNLDEQAENKYLEAITWEHGNTFFRKYALNDKKNIFYLGGRLLKELIVECKPENSRPQIRELHFSETTAQKTIPKTILLLVTRKIFPFCVEQEERKKIINTLIEATKRKGLPRYAQALGQVIWAHKKGLTLTHLSLAQNMTETLSPIRMVIPKVIWLKIFVAQFNVGEEEKTLAEHFSKGGI